MKFEFSTGDVLRSRRNVIKFLLLVAAMTAVIACMLEPDRVFRWIGKGVTLFAPFLAGLAVAFIMDIPTSFLERRVFCGDAHPKRRSFWEKHGRKIAVLVVVLLVLLGLVVALFAVLPQLIDSLRKLSQDLPGYVENTKVWLIGIIDTLPFGVSLQDDLMGMIRGIDLGDTLKLLLGTISDWLGSVVDITIGITSGTVSAFVSFVLSIYLLIGKRGFLLNTKRVLYAFFRPETCRSILRVLTMANRSFSGFVSGQCTEALILGSLCGIGMLAFGMPFALVISLLVTLAALIPFFGGIISAVGGTLLLLFVNPTSAIWFLIFIVVLQQIEGNFIYPRVVGSSIGLPGIWVLLAVYCGGAAFGFLGILLGVPTCSLLYALLKDWTNVRLKERDISEKALADGCMDEPEAPLKTELQQEDAKVKPSKKR